MSCSPACFEATISACDDIILNGGFQSEDQAWVLLKKVGSSKVYQIKVTTQIIKLDWCLVIPKSFFPDGYFRAGNKYKIELRDENYYNTVKNFIVHDIQYPCIIFKTVDLIKADDDGSQTNVIGPDINTGFLTP